MMLDPDDVVVTVATKWGDVPVTLAAWMRNGPGPYPLLRPIAARHRETGEPLPLDAIPLRYRNDAEALALIAAGELDDPWGRPAEALRSLSKEAADHEFLLRQYALGDFLEAALPAMRPGQCALYHAEADTTIVLTTAGQRFAGAGELYLVFDSIEDLERYALARVAADPAIECLAVDYEGEDLELIGHEGVEAAAHSWADKLRRWWRRRQSG